MSSELDHQYSTRFRRSAARWWDRTRESVLFFGEIEYNDCVAEIKQPPRWKRAEHRIRNSFSHVFVVDASMRSSTTTNTCEREFLFYSILETVVEDQAKYITDANAMMGTGYESRQIITEVSGFIPVFDVVSEFYDDPITALVFGRMWNYFGMKDGVCKAGLERLASEMRISRATVIRHIEKLCSDKFIIDLTPDRRNRPHEYKDGGKIVMKGSLSAGVSESHSIRKILWQYQKDTATVSERYLIKQGIKQESNQTPLASQGNQTQTPSPRKFPTYINGKAVFEDA
jgi:hypothetical protein